MKWLMLLQLFFIQCIYAQTKPVVRLQMPDESFGGSNGSAVVWHPLQKKYIAAMAGNARYPLAIFDATGKRLSAEDQSCQYDIRGLWFHPEQQLVQGNAYNEGGWFAYSISADQRLAGKLLQTGSHQPDPQSVGNYFSGKKRIGFLNGNKLTFYFPNNGEVDVEQSLVLQPLYPDVAFPDDLSEDYNASTAVFTGISGKEVGLLNVTEGQVELYDLQSGKCTGVAKIPSDINYLYSMFNFAYTNQLFWFFDKETRTWNGFKLNITAPKSVATTSAQTTATSGKSSGGEALYQQGMTQKAAKNYSSGIASMQSAIQQQYATVDVYYQLAWMQSETGQYAAALQTLQQAQAAGLKDARFSEEKAYSLRKLGKYNEAIVEYKSAIAANPKKATLYKDAGDTYLLSGNKIAAMDQYKQCLQLDPNHYWANYELGLLYGGNNDYTNAAAHLLKATQIKPNQYEGLVELGYVYYKLKQNTEAMSVLNRAAAADPKQATPFKVMGDIYRINYTPAMKAEAKSAYQKALAIDKTSVGANYGLGWIYNSEQQYAAAVGVLEQAYQKNSKDRAVLTELGYAYYGKENYVTALVFLKEAMNIDPNAKNPLYYAGLCYCRLKDKSAAQSIYDRLLRIDASTAEKLKKEMSAL